MRLRGSRGGRIHLVRPAPGYLFGPSVSPACLQAYLEQAHIPSLQHDLGLALFERYTSASWIARSLERARALLVRRPSDLAGLGPDAAAAAFVLRRMQACEVLLREHLAAEVAGALATLRSPADFVSGRARSYAVLDWLARLLGAAWFPYQFNRHELVDVGAQEGARGPECEFLGGYVEERLPRDLERVDWLIARPDDLWADFVRDWLATDPLHDAGLVGLSLFSSTHALFGLVAARLIRARYPDLPILAGGPAITRLHAQRARFPRFDPFPRLLEICDAFVIGEGERPLVDVWEAVQGKRPLERCRALVYLADGAVRVPATTEAHDLDSLPAPSFAGLDLGRFPIAVPSAIVPTARNCNFRCAFCAYNAHELTPFREQSPARTAEVMAELAARHGLRLFRLGESNMLPRTARALAREVEARGLDVRWEVQMVLTPQVDATFAEGLHRGGCRAVHYGVEAGNAALRRRMNKPMKLDNAGIVAAVGHLAAAGIDVYTNFIVGFPGETRAEFEDTLALAEALYPLVYAIPFSMFSVEPTSFFFLDGERYGSGAQAELATEDVLLALSAPIHFRFAAPYEEVSVGEIAARFDLVRALCRRHPGSALAGGQDLCHRHLGADLETNLIVRTLSPEHRPPYRDVEIRGLDAASRPVAYRGLVTRQVVDAGELIEGEDFPASYGLLFDPRTESVWCVAEYYPALLEACDGRTTAREVAERIGARFEIAPDLVLAQLGQLHAESLIVSDERESP